MLGRGDREPFVSLIADGSEWRGVTNADGESGETFHVLTVRGGKIVDMQDCDSRGQAERFAHRQ